MPTTDITTDMVNWNAIASTPKRRISERKKSARPNFGMAIMLVSALAAHGAIGYFGYLWINSHAVPRQIEKVRPPVFSVGSDLNKRASVKLPPPPREDMNEKLRWSRTTGWGTEPDEADNWKCAGGYYYSTTVAPNGTTVIELVLSRNRPLRCNG